MRHGNLVYRVGDRSNHIWNQQVHVFKYLGFSNVNSWGDPLLSRGAMPPSLT